MGDQQGRLATVIGPIADMKIIEITNVDFSLRQFLLPLMRAMRARGHEVIGVCADGPFLDVPRAEGFRIEALKLERSVSLAAHWRAFRALVRLFRAERPDLVHAHMPISGFLARMAAWWAGVPRDRLYRARVLVQLSRLLAAQRRRLRDGMAGGSGHRHVPHRQRGGGTRCKAAAHPPRRRRGRQWPRSGTVPARSLPPAQRVRAALGVPDEQVVVLAVSRLVWHKGYPELAVAHADGAGCGAMGRWRAADLRSRADMAALLRMPAWANGFGCWATVTTCRT